MTEKRHTILADRPATESVEHKLPVRKFLFALLVVVWLLVLDNFTSTAAWILLTVFGAGLLIMGGSLVIATLPHLGVGVQYAALFVLGLVLLVASLATLAPGLPGSWLSGTSIGWSFLDGRAGRLAEAISQKDLERAGRIASRGLGEYDPVDRTGRPLLFGAGDPRMLRALLEAGLIPDATDTKGRTLLMLTHDLGIALALLESGADPNIRDIDGKTPLFYASKKDIDFLELLLAAGADVHAVDLSGIAVADHFDATGRSRTLLERYAGSRPLPLPRPLESLGRGSRDWLIAGQDPREPTAESEITIAPTQLHPGDLATIRARIGNDSAHDRLLEVRASLNQAAYFVSASHGGRVENPHRPVSIQTIRWPLLALPAHSVGLLSLDIVTPRESEDVGDLEVDVRYHDFRKTEDELLRIYRTFDRGGVVSESFDWIELAGDLVLISVVYLIFRKLVKTLKAKSQVSVIFAFAATICLVIAVIMIMGMLEPWITFNETSCEVPDRRVLVKQSSTSCSGSRGGGNCGDSKPTLYRIPQIAARYTAQGHERTEVGFSTGMEIRTVRDLYRFPLNATVACWYDPDEPSRFTVVRDVGLRGITGLVLLAFTLLFSLLAARLARDD